MDIDTFFNTWHIFDFLLILCMYRFSFSSKMIVKPDSGHTKHGVLLSTWLVISRTHSVFSNHCKGFPSGTSGKESACQCWRYRRHRFDRSLGQEDTQEEKMATHSHMLAWRIPCTEQPYRLKFVGSQRFRHNHAYRCESSLSEWTVQNSRHVKWQESSTIYTFSIL